MPSSSNPRPRRETGGAVAPSSRRAAAPRAATSAAERTVGVTPQRVSSRKAPPKSLDPGVKRRTQKKTQARQRSLMSWVLAAAVSVMIGGTAMGVWSELGSTRGRVAQKQATLADLSAQLVVGKRRLRALAAASGKERVLVENGFIKPGERLLLFPKAALKK